MTAKGDKGLVAIQGYEGSFHQEAAFRFFGKDCSIRSCETFRKVVQATTANQEVVAGVIAIENSIAGSILPNYTLLGKNPVTIVGEVYLQINQQLMVNHGVTFDQIKEVHSHPMALLQCMDYLEKQPHWKLIEAEDTALSARNVSQRKSKTIAAIASKLAAELYDLDIIAPNIHTLKNNYTRFLILQHEKLAQPVAGANKASILFNTDHSRGSLAKALERISAQGVNLSKLQSMPIPGTNFQYAFHADMEFEEMAQYTKAMEKLKGVTESIKVFGVYKNGH